MATPNKQDKEVLLDHFNDSIKSVFDLTSRIDERVKMLINRQGSVDEQLDRAIQNQQQILSRVTVLESRDLSSLVESSKIDIGEIKQRVAIMENSNSEEDIEELKQQIHLLDLKVESVHMRTASQESRWAKLFDLVFKLSIMMIGGYLLFKFGWQAPP